MRSPMHISQPLSLLKSVGGASAGGGLLGFAKKVLNEAKGGEKFNKSDVKRVYFVGLIFESKLNS